MIIINADDWGRSRSETDAALVCYQQRRITSVSAMVFMEDSRRAANLANEIGIDVGLHLNLTQRPSGKNCGKSLMEYHDRVSRFLALNKYALLIYNPALRSQFRYVYQCQYDEFVRLYGRTPSHIDGHHHQHLCANMLLDNIISKGEKVRRSFYFWPNEKSLMNRTYRRLINLLLARRYRLTDFFFALSQCMRAERLRQVADLAMTFNVELMTHPRNPSEQAFLMSDDFPAILERLKTGTYSAI